MVESSLCRPGWPGTLGDLPLSAPWVLWWRYDHHDSLSQPSLERAVTLPSRRTLTVHCRTETHAGLFRASYPHLIWLSVFVMEHLTQIQPHSTWIFSIHWVSPFLFRLGDSVFFPYLVESLGCRCCWVSSWLTPCCSVRFGSRAVSTVAPLPKASSGLGLSFLSTKDSLNHASAAFPATSICYAFFFCTFQYLLLSLIFIHLPVPAGAFGWNERQERKPQANTFGSIWFLLSASASHT